ncbi:bola-like protein, partial [Suillus subalutaceus]|uniref:bola-like protein n=1 Tax=Suillus subalutaceus TaxID=48586 RepID=UPI001B860D4F
TLLQPTKLIITNESQLHRHHAAMRSQGGGNGEKHVSACAIQSRVYLLYFLHRTRLQRHRLIYSALSEEFSQGLHALSLNTKTSEEAQRYQAEK